MMGGNEDVGNQILLIQTDNSAYSDKLINLPRIIFVSHRNAQFGH
jgi:hypothetical protein